MEHNAENICRIAISSKEQNLDKQMVEFGISMLFQYFMYILEKLNTFSRSWKPISQFNSSHCFEEQWVLFEHLSRPLSLVVPESLLLNCASFMCIYPVYILGCELWSTEFFSPKAQQVDVPLPFSHTISHADGTPKFCLFKAVVLNFFNTATPENLLDCIYPLHCIQMSNTNIRWKGWYCLCFLLSISQM